MEEIDLFEHIEDLPQNVQTILETYEDLDATYDNCRAMLTELEAVGYTFEYYLDAIPVNLTRINLEVTK